jgi:ribonuclease P protein component
MISYKNRFHGHGALRYVSKNGTSIRSQYVTIKYLKNPRRKESRIGVVVSKKVHKGAVGRNRIRRRVYEQLRLQLPEMKSGYDIVCFVASAQIRTIPTNELTQIIETSLQEAGIYKTALKSDTIE